MAHAPLDTSNQSAAALFEESFLHQLQLRLRALRCLDHRERSGPVLRLQALWSLRRAYRVDEDGVYNRGACAPAEKVA
jgi:hypothetical protein